MTAKVPSNPPPKAYPTTPAIRHDPPAILKVRRTYHLLAFMAEPGSGGSIIGGSRSSGHDSSREPDAQHKPDRSRLRKFEDDLISLAMRYLSDAQAVGEPRQPDTRWHCRACTYRKAQPASGLFCTRCGAPRPAPQNPVSTSSKFNSTTPVNGTQITHNPEGNP